MENKNKDFYIWLAGFFDGEGCVNINNRIDKGGTVTFRVIITQYGERGYNILKNIQEYFPKAYLGKKTDKRGWELVIYNRSSVKEFLECIQSYLKVKNSEVKLFIYHLKNYDTNKITPPKKWR